MNADCGMRNAEWSPRDAGGVERVCALKGEGRRNADLGLWNAEWGFGNGDCGLRNAEWADSEVGGPRSKVGKAPDRNARVGAETWGVTTPLL